MTLQALIFGSPTSRILKRL